MPKIFLENYQEEAIQFHGTIGDLFMQLCHGEDGNGNSQFINMYSTYMNEFREAMQMLTRYENSSETFRQEIRTCQQSAKAEGLSLAAFLLTPVQRLPRYELLLKVCGYVCGRGRGFIVKGCAPVVIRYSGGKSSKLFYFSQNTCIV